MRIRFRGAVAENEAVGADAGPVPEEIVRYYLPQVGVVLRALRRTLPDFLDFDELYSVGLYGLVKASGKFDPARKSGFEAYVRSRIRGAILDELRRLDVMSRTARAKARSLQRTVEELEQKLGRAPNDEELRSAMEMSRRDFSRFLNRARSVQVVSLDTDGSSGSAESDSLHESIRDEGQETSLESILRKELTRLLNAMVSELPDRQRRVVSMYYYQGMRLAQIAQVFGLTEARICQIHAQTIESLRFGMGRAMYA